MRSKLLVACVALAALAGCGGDDDADTTAAQATAAAAETDLGAIKDYLLEHTAKLKPRHRDARRGRRGVLRARRGRRLRLRASCWPTSATRSAEPSRACRRRSARPTRPTRRWRASSPACPSLADFDVIIDAGADASRPRERRAVLDQDAGRQDVQAAGQLLLPDRDARCAGPSRSSRPRASSPTSTATARSSSARRCPTPTSSWPPRATSRPTPKDLDAAANEWEPTRAGRVHGGGRDDADDVGVLRGVEELALHRRRQGGGERLRRRLAPAGHRRHPRRPRARLRQHRAEVPRPTRSRRSRPAATSRTSTSSRPSCATRRRAARSSRPRRPTRSGRTRRTVPRRSPARSARPPDSSTSSWRARGADAPGRPSSPSSRSRWSLPGTGEARRRRPGARRARSATRCSTRRPS